MLMRKRNSMAIIMILSVCLFFGNPVAAFASEPADMQLQSSVPGTEEDTVPDPLTITDPDPDAQITTDPNPDAQITTNPNPDAQITTDPNPVINPNGDEVLHHLEIPVTHESGVDLPGGDEDTRFEDYVDRIMSEGTGPATFTLKRF